METCLVTKLKGSVDNNNLPIFNTIFLTAYNNETTANYNAEFSIYTGNEPVKVSFTVPFARDGISDNKEENLTEYTIPAKTLMYFNKRNLTFDLENCIKVENIYDIKAISGNKNICVNESIEAIYSNKNLFALSTTFLNTPSYVPKNTKVLGIGIKNNAKAYLEDGEIENMYNTDAFLTTFGGYLHYLTGITLGETLKNSNVRFFSARAKGDITCFPKTIIYISISDGLWNGAIEDLVASMVERGRTTGNILIKKNSYMEVTYQGRLLRDRTDLMDSANNFELFWNNNTIEFKKDKSAEYYTYMPDGSSISYYNYIQRVAKPNFD